MKADATSKPAIYLLVLLLIAAGAAYGIPHELLQFVAWRTTLLVVASVHTLVVLGACVSLGLLVVPVSAWRALNLSELLLIALGCGAGLLSCALLLLGIAGLGSVSGHWILLAACFATGIGYAIHAKKRFIGWQDSKPALHSGRSFVLRLAWLAAALCVVVAAYAPPLLFDVTEYHLGAWSDYKRSLPSGRFIRMPHNFYARFPFPIESLYFLGLSIGSPMDFAPKLLNASFVFACAGVASQLLRRCGVSSNWRLLTALLVLSHPVMRSVSLDAYIDAPCAFLVLAAILALSIPSGEMMIPAAFLFGTALAAKYTNAQLFLLPFVVCYAAPAIGRTWREGSRKLVIAALIFGSLPLAAWLGKNVFFYGNPLEPFFAWLFRQDNPAAIAREKFYIESHYPQAFWTVGYWRTLLPRLREFGYPLLTLLLLVPAMRQSSGGTTTAPWTLQPARALLFVAGSYLLWNLVRESQNRFLLPAIAVVLIIGIRAAAAIPMRGVRIATGFFLAAWASFHVLHQGITLQSAGEFRYFTEFELTERPAPTVRSAELQQSPREEFYKRNLGALGEMLPRLAELPPEAEVLMVYEARPYLVPRGTIYNTVWDDSELLRLSRGASSGAEVAAKLRSAGITHVLVNREELRRYIQQYIRPATLRRMGIAKGDDPAMAFYATPTPEDHYPPFYRDAAWNGARAAILEFLMISRAKAIAVTGTAPLEIYLAPLL